MKRKWDFGLTANVAYQSDLLASRIKVEMYELHTSVSVPTLESNISVVTSPASSRGVRVANGMKKNELILVPLSPTLSVTKTASEKLPLLAVEVGILPADAPSAKHKWYVVPKLSGLDDSATSASTARSGKDAKDAKPVKDEFIAPFWFVETTLQAAEVNMELKLYQCACGSYPCYVNSKALKEGDVLKGMAIKGATQRYPANSTLKIVKHT